MNPDRFIANYAVGLNCLFSVRELPPKSPKVSQLSRGAIVDFVEP